MIEKEYIIQPIHTTVDDTYVTGGTFNTSTGDLDLNIFTGDTVSVNLDNRYLNASAYTESNINITGGTTGQILSKVSATDYDTEWVNAAVGGGDYTTGATFNTSTGILEFTRQSGSTYNVDLDDRYSLTGHTHSGFGDVTKVGTPVNNQVGIWTGDGTLEGDAKLTFDGTKLIVGENDVSRGEIRAYGGAIALGGAVTLYNSADSDGGHQAFTIKSIYGDFEIAESETFFSYTTSTSQLAFPMYGGGTISGTSTYNLAVTSGGTIIETALATGDVTKVGTPANNQVGVWTGDGTLEGDTDFTWSGTQLQLGTNDTTLGKLVLYGDNSVSSGIIQLWNGSAADTNDEYYSIYAQGGILHFKGASTGDFLTYNSSTQNLDLGADTVQFSTYGGGTITGTTTYGLGVDVSGNIVETALPTADVTKVGTPANNQIGVWTGDGTIEGDSKFTFDGQGTATFIIGSHLGITASMRLYGAIGGATGGNIRFYNTADYDTDDAYYESVASSGSYTLKANTTGTFFTYTSATQSLAFPDYGGGTITGTSTYNLAVTSGGTIIETALATGDVSKVGTPVDNQVGVWTGDGTLEGTINLNFAGGNVSILKVGADDNNTGAVYLYGDDGGSGGSIRLYNGAGGDSNVNVYQMGAAGNDGLFQLKADSTLILEYTPSSQNLDLAANTVQMSAYGGGTISGTSAYNLAVTSGGTIIETALATGDVTKVGTPLANELPYWTGDGTIAGDQTARLYTAHLYLGTSDTIKGALTLQGSSGVDGGIINIYNGAGGDGLTDYFKIDTVSGTFRIGESAGISFFEYSSLNEQISLPQYGGGTITGTTTYGLAVDVSGNIIETTLATGDVTKVGTPVNNQVGVWTGDGTLEGGVGITSPIDGYLYLGVDDTSIGVLSLFGDSGGNGGEIRMYNGNSGDGTDGWYYLEAQGGEFIIQGSVSGDVIRYTSQTGNLKLGANTLQATQYGGGTITGTSTYNLAVTSGGTIIETALATGDVTKVGTPAPTQVGVWTGDGTLEGTFNLKYSGTVFSVGADGTTRGLMYLYGDSSINGGAMTFYNGSAGDTDDEGYSIRAKNGVFGFENWGGSNFISYTSATSQLAFPMYGGGTITGTTTYGLGVDVSGNVVETALPSVTKVGTPLNNQVGVWTGDGTLEGDTKLTFLNGTFSVGIDNINQGVVNAYGDSTTFGGQLKIHNASNDSTDDGYYRISTAGGALNMLGIATGTFLTYTSATSQLAFPMYGGGTITGTTTYGLGVDVSGNIVETALADKSVSGDTGTTYNFVIEDTNNIVTLNNGSAVSAVIPANASVAYKIGTEISIINLGAGVVTVSITTDTLNGNVGGLTLAQYDKRTITKVTATSWILGY